MRTIYELIKKENGKPMSFKQIMTRQKAFETIKAKLTMTLVIIYFNFDKLFILYIDVLDEGIKTILY